MTSLSIIIPAKNEASGLMQLLPKLLSEYPDAEIIVVNDGSTDETHNIIQHNRVIEISHPYSKGNGAAIKSGVRAARGDILAFMDADGQHRPEDLKALLKKMSTGYDMIVGARAWGGQANVHRGLANTLYNQLASLIVGQPVSDLTSGMRVAKATLFREFLPLLPNGFSYPTTSTMAFFRAGYSVGYHPISVTRREGPSHIRVVRDGLRFLIIIFKIGTLYSPLKIFVPLSALFFMIATGYYGLTYYSTGRFTNMSALLYITSMLIFLIGLVSEQITALTFIKSNDA